MSIKRQMRKQNVMYEVYVYIHELHVCIYIYKHMWEHTYTHMCIHIRTHSGMLVIKANQVLLCAVT